MIMGKLRARSFDLSNKEAIKFRLEAGKYINGDCWGYKDNSITRHTKLMFGYKEIGLHVISGYVFLNHDLNDSLMTLYKCGNAGCWNPDHLYKGNHIQNMKDCIEHGAFPKSNATHCKNGHEYTSGSFRIRRGWRECYACIRLHNANRRKKGK